jgi:hypothetical protein
MNENEDPVTIEGAMLGLSFIESLLYEKKNEVYELILGEDPTMETLFPLLIQTMIATLITEAEGRGASLEDYIYGLRIRMLATDIDSLPV